MVFIHNLLKLIWGGRWDSNPRSPEPQSGALNQLGHAHHVLLRIFWCDDKSINAKLCRQLLNSLLY